MVLFSRAAAPAAQESPTKKTAGCQPPHSAEDLIIPPPFERYCLMGFAAQVVLDVCTVVVIFCLKGAFFTIPVACVCLVLDFAMLVWTSMATPRPIDVLMKNALSGVAWFMLAVINGAIIGERENSNPYPPFVMCLFTFIVNLGFWCWTLWWGLNDRGPRSMYPQQRAKRCFNCRTGAYNRTIPRNQSTTAGRFSPTESLVPRGGDRGIPMEAVRGLQPRDEEGGKRITGLQHHHQASQPSFASSCFTERELAETEREGVAASPV